MNRFRYLRDGLFWSGSVLYSLNRWVVKPHVHSAFFRFHFNDCLLMPCALPPLLWLHRRLGLRTHDEMPTAGEITLYFAIWSALFEGIGPHLFRRATGDPLDVLAYSVGALIAGLWWHRHQLISPPVAS